MVTEYLTRTGRVRVEFRTRVVRVAEAYEMKVVVVGGTGQIGRRLIRALTAQGHEAIAASPSAGVDTITGEGLAEALVGAQVVVDTTDSPVWGEDEVLAFFTTSTRNQIEAGRRAG